MNNIKNLPKEINGFQLRNLTIDNFTVLDYSRSYRIDRYINPQDLNPEEFNNDILYEVRAETMDEVEDLMLKKLN